MVVNLKFKILALVPLVMVIALFGCTAKVEPSTITDPTQFEFKELQDVPADPMDYKVTNADMQLPELPTGCEATALATLLRIHGVPVTKTEVADALPKSNSDFVDSFLGDPYSNNGGLCMVPCLEATANEFLYDTELIAYGYEGYALQELPTPCAIWATIDLATPEFRRQQGEYTMYYPSHCMVLLKIDGNAAIVIDPLKGKVEYNADKLAKVYDILGAQALYIN